MTTKLRDEDFYSRRRVFEATEHLPFNQVEALWLIDVCSYDYGSAASSIGTSTRELARRLHTARCSIRRHIDRTHSREHSA